MIEDVHEQQRGDFQISTDRLRLDVELIHEFLSNSYWSKGIPSEIVRRAIKHSLCFGIYKKEKQVGFARIISDFATYAYIADVFVVQSCRGISLSKWLMECILAHPQLQGLRRWSLVTADAHGLYARFGFKPPQAPHRWMEILRSDVYDQLL